jgi:hypothetical protein
VEYKTLVKQQEGNEIRNVDRNSLVERNLRLGQKKFQEFSLSVLMFISPTTYVLDLDAGFR